MTDSTMVATAISVLAAPMSFRRIQADGAPITATRARRTMQDERVGPMAVIAAERHPWISFSLGIFSSLALLSPALKKTADWATTAITMMLQAIHMSKLFTAFSNCNTLLEVPEFLMLKVPIVSP
jgi:hypothetical protein